MTQQKIDSTGDSFRNQNKYDSTEDAADILYHVVNENTRVKDFSNVISSGENLLLSVISEDDRIVSIRKMQLKNTFKKAFEFLSTYENQNQADQAKKIVSLIKNAVKLKENIAYPEIVFFEIDDKSLGMQWDYLTYTFGVGFEENKADSYWFMLGGPKDKIIKARGNLENTKALKYYIYAMVEQ
jgi:hypothetical protein